MTDADRVAKFAGPNQIVRILKVPMRLHAMPTPMSSLPKTSSDGDSAQAKIRTPTSASRCDPGMVFFGPA